MEELAVKREIGIITAEIITIRENTKRMVLESFIEIGRRLLEAKEVVGHGGWGDYLREKVEFSPSTANNMINLYKEYGDEQTQLGKPLKSQTFGNLTYSQAVALLALPEEQRETVVAEHNMEATSVRELQAIIEEKKREAKQAREEAERVKQAAAVNEKTILEYQAELKRQEAKLKDARGEIEKLEARPVEVAVQPPSKEELAEIQRDAEAAVAEKFEEELAAVREELAGTRGQLEEARQAGEQQLARAAEMEKKLAVAGNKEMVEFNILFRRAQEEMERLHQKYLAITANEPEKAAALKTAVGRMIQMVARKWEG
ncbi:MAG: DUF3102 domain-containing protein [Angelakisella sp.]|jgi:hypothetical protein|nr:DUF3102 domain-containing protein [Angelakisella sp.]